MDEKTYDVGRLEDRLAALEAVAEAARKAVAQIRTHGETCHTLTDALAALDALPRGEGGEG